MLTEPAAETARHCAQDHSLGQAPKVQAPVKQVVLRASGAEFI